MKEKFILQLHVAAANGYYDVAAFLLRCGVSPSVRDNDLWMPVHAAACWAQPDLVELLCEYGADINAKTNNGETPLGLPLSFSFIALKFFFSFDEWTFKFLGLVREF